MSFINKRTGVTRHAHHPDLICKARRSVIKQKVMTNIVVIEEPDHRGTHGQEAQW